MFRRTKRASTAGSITCVVVPAFPVRWRTRPAPHRPAFFGGLAEPLLHVLDRLSLADAVHQGRRPSDRAGPAVRSATSRPHRARRKSPRAGAPARRPTTRAWRRRHDGARPWRSSTPAARDAENETLSHATGLQSGTRTGRRRSRRPARPLRCGSRRAQSVRAHARTAPGPGSSTAGPSGRRSA